MAFTKVVGPGIHTLSNIASHNINSSGIITATKFVGPFDNINVGGATTLTVDGINISAGILTAQTLDLNGNGDISGNLVLGGDLTVNGTTTTLDTNLIGVDRVEVGAAGAVVGLAVTQSGTADLVRLYDGSTQVVTVDDEGNVGLGSAIPSVKLDVAGIIKATDFKAPDGNTNGFYVGGSDDLHLFHNGSDSYIENDTGNLTFTNKNNNNIIFKTTSSETEVVRINKDGEVGIGTNNPVTQLEIHGDTGGTIRLAKGVTSREVLAGDTLGKIEFRSYDGSLNYNPFNGTYVEIETVAVDALGGTPGENVRLDFKIADSDEPGSGKAITPVPALSILQGGKIGIGTTVPEKQLSILGDADTCIRVTSSAGEYSSIQFGDTADTVRGGITYYSGDDSLQLRGYNNSTKLRLGPNGELLTGGATTEPLYPHFVTARKAQMEVKGALDVGQTRHHGSFAVNCTNSNSSIHLVRSDNTQTDGTDIGVIGWVGYDGSDFHQAAAIMVEKGAGAGNNDQPGHMIFKTNEGTTSATERLRITSDGSVGIGTDNVQTLLHLKSSDPTVRIQRYNQSAYGDITVDTAGRITFKSDPGGAASGDGFSFTVNNSEKFNVDSDGNATFTGEVAAAQEYPVVKPTLDLNFAGTANLDPRVTFTRVGSASYYGRDGLLKFAAHNEPRFDHDPITRECKGLLIEEERQNWAYNSYRANNDYGGGGATYDDMGYNMINNAVTINDFGTAPDGTNTATKMYPASSGGARGIELQMSLNSTGNWTNSIYVKAAGHTGWIALYGVNGGARAYFNPSTGAKGSSSGTNAPSSGKYGIQDVGNGWYRIHITVNLTTTGGTEYHYIYFGDSDNSTNVTASGTNGILMWGLQVEKGDFPTSYIRTDSRHRITRAADQCYIDGQDFLDFYNQTEGTMISSHSILSDEISSSHNLYTYQISPTGATAYAPLRLLDKNASYGNSLTAASVYNNGTVFLVQDTGSPATVTGRKYKVAVSIKKDDYDAVFDGGDLKSDGSGDLYTADHMSIGYYKPSPQAYLNGHIQRLTYYPFKLTNNQLKTVTS